MRIQGRVIVSSDGRGLEGVKVHDGYSILVTDEKGEFAFDVHDDREFVFLTVPGGYVAKVDQYNRPLFYQRINEGNQPVIFELTEQSQDDYVFVQLTDLHLGRGDGLTRFQAEVIPEINALLPDFVVITGDIAFQEGIVDRFLEIQQQFRMPIYHAIGNHEMMMDRIDPKVDFKRLFGPTYYSFDFGNAHYIVLDGCLPAPYRSGWKNVLGFVDDAQLKWLRQDLELHRDARMIVAFIHIPIASRYSERKGFGRKDEPAWEIINDEEVIELLSKHSVYCVFQGHMHENEHLHVEGVHFVESASVSGAWWSGPNLDGSPQGYRIVRVKKDRVETEYRGFGQDEPSFMEIECKETGHPGEIELSVNVFDGDPYHDKVHCRLGSDEAWLPLEPLSTFRHPHLWRGKIRTETDSGNRVEIRIKLEANQTEHIQSTYWRD